MNASFNERSENDSTTHSGFRSTLLVRSEVSRVRYAHHGYHGRLAVSVSFCVPLAIGTFLPATLIEECVRGRRRFGGVDDGFV
jgi:hypothetical protein